MEQEIERKFIVKGDDWRSDVTGSRRFRQGYIETEGDSTVRIREYKTHGAITVKGPREELSRSEFEYNISRGDAASLLETFVDSGLIEKTRHRVRVEGDLWEVDVFSGDNTGLILAEIELESEADEVELPPWLGTEVTRDARFRNSQLAVNPISQWSSEQKEGLPLAAQ